jgi:succinate dehydrogenase / fumarate reductase, iron-sulfur subunit
MSEMNWTVIFQISRQKGGQPAHFDEFKLEVSPDEYVLDGIERIWAQHDRSLVYRHACHHSTCGACGMRVNGAEKLACITPIRSVVADGGALRVEPMRNFPVISDLAVDMGVLYQRMGLVGQRQINLDEKEAVQPEERPAGPDVPGEHMLRLSDCIECGLCISACPITASSPGYLGPAVLAGAHQRGIQQDEQLFKLVNSEDGVWRCHSAYECTAVCPSFVDPGWRIMDLRKQILARGLTRFFRGEKPKEELEGGATE